jgi:GNAT superfamily N-acetyltransferase
MSNTLHLLDNPIWYALKTDHQEFAIGDETIQRYPAHILPFIAFDDMQTYLSPDIEKWFDKGEKIFALGELPVLPGGWKILATHTCVQMICTATIAFTSDPDCPVVRLNHNTDELFDFVNSIQPGLFRKGTPLAGDYYGIKINGKLVATAGKRFSPAGYTEVSAICTHPDFTGRGFARHLIAYVCHEIQGEGRVPFLHVLNTNYRAINVYEYSGFVKRREIPFHQIGLPV